MTTHHVSSSPARFKRRAAGRRQSVPEEELPRGDGFPDDEACRSSPTRNCSNASAISPSISAATASRACRNCSNSSKPT